jgi:hypothetical protein
MATDTSEPARYASLADSGAAIAKVVTFFFGANSVSVGWIASGLAMLPRAESART